MIYIRLRGELGLLFLARPAGQSVLIPAGRPARRVYELRPAGRPAGYLCIGVVFWPAGRPADGWLYLQLAKVSAGRLAAWLVGWLARWLGWWA